MKKCSFLFTHNWGKWVKTKEGAITIRGQDTTVVGYYIIQERQCQDCGRIDLNKQEQII